MSDQPGPFGAGARGPFGPGDRGPFGAAPSAAPSAPAPPAPRSLASASPAPAPPASGPSGFAPPGHGWAGGPVVVHRARLGARLAIVAGVMVVTTAVIGAIAWVAVLRAGPAAHDHDTATGPTVTPVGAPPATVGPPTGWPEALAPPPDARIVSSVVSAAGGPGEQMVLVYEAPGGLDAVADAVRAQLVGAGLVIVSDSGLPGTPAALVAEGAGRRATVAVAPTPAQPDVATVTWVLRSAG